MIHLYYEIDRFNLIHLLIVCWLDELIWWINEWLNWMGYKLVNQITTPGVWKNLQNLRPYDTCKHFHFLYSRRFVQISSRYASFFRLLHIVESFMWWIRELSIVQFIRSAPLLVQWCSTRELKLQWCSTSWYLLY